MSTATQRQAPGKNVGRVTQVIGSTFDVEFPENSIPSI
jgi:F0F1-type ATP synthase beta subunit